MPGLANSQFIIGRRSCNITVANVDEAVSARGEVSWVSPMARTLLKACQGDVLKLVTPTGAVEIEAVLVSSQAQVSC